MFFHLVHVCGLKMTIVSLLRVVLAFGSIEGGSILNRNNLKVLECICIGSRIFELGWHVSCHCQLLVR